MQLHGLSHRRQPYLTRAVSNLDRSQICGIFVEMPSTPELEQMLRAASLRVTRPRVAVLAAVHEEPHADTAAIAGLVRGELGTVSQQAVYDVLHALTAASLVRRIQPPDSVARYEARIGDNHHHVDLPVMRRHRRRRLRSRRGAVPDRIGLQTDSTSTKPRSSSAAFARNARRTQFLIPRP